MRKSKGKKEEKEISIIPRYANITAKKNLAYLSIRFYGSIRPEDPEGSEDSIGVPRQLHEMDYKY